MMRKGTMTITLSLPQEWQVFFDDLAASGYNRSMLMLRMAEILKVLHAQQATYPGGLPTLIDHVSEYVAQGKLQDFIEARKKHP